MTTQATDTTQFTKAASSELTTCVDCARSVSGTESFLSQSRCVDLLLDCFNAADRPTVRDVVSEALAAVSQLRLVKADHFRSALDEIELAQAVDTIFDRFDLA